MAGSTRSSTKHGFWHRLFHNQWIVVGGVGVIAVGTIFATLCSAQLGTTSGASSVREGRIEETATPEGTATGTATATATSTATATPSVQRRFAAAPELQIDPNKQYFATIKTDKGDIRLELYPKDAPQAVNNFVFLARNDFYDGLTFHRVIDGFVAQGGDPEGSGAGGPGYNLPDEKNSLRHDAGVIAMARSARGTDGSQFYITMTPQYGLDAQGFTPFGRVVQGQDVLQRLTRRDPQRNARAAPGDQITEIVIEER